tara:strand:- start:1908 stop:2888 length:981 start_codon:yes stop_codon:yes gene_type:complete
VSDQTNHPDHDAPAADGLSASSESAATGGIGELARRYRRRATDLLAVGMLLVVGLALGRQLTSWWNEPGLESTPNADGVTGAGTAWTEPDDLQLGELATTIHRRRLVGDRAVAWRALESSTRATAETAGWPETDADEAEQQLLKVLAGRESNPGPGPSQAATSLHRLEGPLPMVVAVRQLLGQRRVVGWGLATRTPRDEWVTWTFAAAGDVAAEPVELPADCRRLLAVGDGDPERLVVFTGSPGPDGWWEHFERELHDDGWTMTSPPSRHREGWTARWQHPSGRTVVVSLRHDNSGRWHGMLNVFTPVRPGTIETSPVSPGEREST